MASDSKRIDNLEAMNRKLEVAIVELQTILNHVEKTLESIEKRIESRHEDNEMQLHTVEAVQKKQQIAINTLLEWRKTSNKIYTLILTASLGLIGYIIRNILKGG